MNEFYYEVGVNPTGDIEDGYSIYVKTEKPLVGTEFDKLRYLIDNGHISESDAKDSMYIKTSVKEEWEWAMKGQKK